MTAQENIHRVIELHAENVRRIKAIDITPPDTGVVIIAGKNAQGKTSTLDALAMAFEGGSKEYLKAIRDGQDKATIEVNCGSFTIKRVIERSGRQTLEVCAADGLKL